MKKIISVVVLSLAMVGCAKKVTAPIPGSANSFDSDTYLTLVTTDSVIQGTKSALAANSFPPAFVSNVKTALNALITAYDAADSVYIVYHNAAMGGTATPTQQAAVATAIGQVQAATTILVAAKGGN